MLRGEVFDLSAFDVNVTAEVKACLFEGGFPEVARALRTVLIDPHSPCWFFISDHPILEGPDVNTAFHRALELVRSRL